MHEIQGNADILGKVFHHPVDDRQHRKLVALIQLCTPDLKQASAWPTDLITTSQGQCVGFVMPRVWKAREIDRLSHPAEQRIAFPAIDYGFLLHAALNLTRAAAAIHAAGCVVGDVNERNVLVLPDGRVRFIDVDSFQIVVGGEVFLCPVGSELFTPPELRGRTLSQETRTVNHDAFGLAVLVFQLLVLGRHPFAGVPRDGKARTIEEAISERAYAYSLDASAKVAPPPGALDIASLGSLPSLFHRAFTTDTRPTAAEWMHAIDRERSRLRRCTRNGRHAILDGTRTCPLCTLRRDPLPGVVSAAVVPDLGGMSIGELLAEVARLRPLQEAKDRCTLVELSYRERMLPEGPPSSAAKGLSIGIAAVAFGVATLCPVPAEARLGVLGVGLAIALIMFGIARGSDAESAERFARLKALAESALQTLQASEDQIALEEERIQAEMRPLWEGIIEAREIVTTYDARVAKALSEAERSWLAHRLDEHLRKHAVRHASIAGIGPSRTATLASFGIETAADVDYISISRIPGFGPELTNRLRAWRTGLERQYLARDHGSVPTEWIERIKRAHHQEYSVALARLRDDAKEFAQRWPYHDRRLSELAIALEGARHTARTAVAAVRV